MESVFKDKKNCSGCGVCAECCPKNAIIMQPDAFGFLQPRINQQLCVDCGICRNACHMLNTHIEKKRTYKVLALKSKNARVLETSQSGGAFTELAKCILSEGGVVYGAAFQERFDVAHIRVDNEEELHKLQGSKYVQSATVGIFGKVKEDLEEQRKVLFSGTPCQVAALKSYLQATYDNLYAVDVVCHGIMPPKIWEDFMSYVKQKYGVFTEVKFRDKTVRGWRDHWESFWINNRKKATCTYRQLFYSNYFLRESCYIPEKGRVICKYGGMLRPSDLTIGDFWGIEETKSSIIDDNTGISLCLVNTQKGKELLKKISDCVFWEEHSEEDVKKRNPHLDEGAPYVQQDLDRARREYLEKGFMFVAKKYADLGGKGFLRKYLRPVKLFVKKLLRR